MTLITYSSGCHIVVDKIQLKMKKTCYTQRHLNKCHYMGSDRHGTQSFILSLGSLPDVRHGERDYLRLQLLFLGPEHLVQPNLGPKCLSMATCPYVPDYCKDEYQ